MLFPYRTPVLAIALLLPAAACGEATPVEFGGSGGGSSSTGSTSSSTSTIPLGSCKATFVDGDSRTVFEGTARARMNGSGNLDVRCDAADGAELNLDFGNATFDGPRTYIADDFSSDGGLDYTAVGADKYDSGRKGSSCALILTEAGPLDARGDSVVKGGTIAATFSCTKLVSASGDDAPLAYVVEDGEVAATVE